MDDLGGKPTILGNIRKKSCHLGDEMLASDHPLPLPPKPEKQNPIALFTALEVRAFGLKKSLIRLPFASVGGGRS